ncbi:hypothetical protein PR048_009631 [Dryococelus australis]|uniref:HTH CENPB-type domain-containing protein n=1 Tax=Dryococelus australis TaxID=614101 RepID=A0ABQ9I1E8_9NEOP|nr:hypothetical protein PR048_009631 [Dryococelus australis]
MGGRGKREIPEKGPPTNGIVRHDSPLRKSGSEPAGDRTRFVLVLSGQSNRSATVATATSLPKIGRGVVLSPEMEQNLLKFIIDMQKLGFGLAAYQVRELAYKLAKTEKREHLICDKTKVASKWWWNSYKERYGLSLRVTENLSAYTASMSSPTMINDYFEKVNHLLMTLGIKDSASRLWNVDETRLCYVVKPNKVVIEIGKSFVYKKVYADRAETHTLIGCICAAGTRMPPFVIFKEVQWNDNLSEGSLPNSRTRLSPKEAPRQKPNRGNFFELFNPAFAETFVAQTIQNFFKRPGIMPPNKSSISIESQAPSKLTEKQSMGEILPGGSPRDSEELLQLPHITRNQTRNVNKKRDGSAKCHNLPSGLGKKSGNNLGRETNRLTEQDKHNKFKQVESIPKPSTSEDRSSLKFDYSDWTCGSCLGKFSSDVKEKTRVSWIQCSFCFTTYHESCQTEPTTDLVYMCHKCAREEEENHE